MENSVVKYCVGIDVSGDKLDCCLSHQNAESEVIVQQKRCFDNTSAAFGALEEWIQKQHRDRSRPLRIVLEATGVYHEAVAHYLYQKGYVVCVVVATKARRYAQSLGLRSKNDRIDAKGLAQMGIQQKLQAWKPMNNHLYQIRALLRFRVQLNQTMTTQRNQLHAQKHSGLPQDFIIQKLQELINDLKEQIKTVDKEIDRLLKEDAELREKIYRIVDSVVGLGWLTVLTIVAETNGFALFFNQRQLMKFCGYDVIENQSGKRQGKTRISKQGNAYIRRALYMPALCVVNYQTGDYHALFERILKRTGIKMKGYVAVQRKLLCLVYALWKKNQAFDPAFKATQNAKKLPEQPPLQTPQNDQRVPEQAVVPALQTPQNNQRGPEQAVVPALQTPQNNQRGPERAVVPALQTPQNNQRGPERAVVLALQTPQNDQRGPDELVCSPT